MPLIEFNFEKLNDLPPDIKVEIARARKLIEETRERMKEQGLDVSLPYRMQLKSDCAELERMMKRFEKARYSKRFCDKFTFNIEKLITESENILKWKFEF